MEILDEKAAFSEYFICVLHSFYVIRLLKNCI